MSTVYKFKKETEFPIAERCSIVEILNNDADSDCSIVRARLEIGVTTKLHSLIGVTERYIIISGKGDVKVGDNEWTPVLPMDVVSIPADTAQQISNTGDEDLIFMCVCTPRFKPECYKNLEK